jgi:Holliday junction resolvase
MNKNYRAGRAFEYEVVEHWRERGYDSIRTAGSHGLYDVIAFRVDRKPEMVQCKRTSRESEAKRLIEEFKKTPPALHYHQSMFVKIKGTKEPVTWTI